MSDPHYSSENYQEAILYLANSLPKQLRDLSDKVDDVIAKQEKYNERVSEFKTEATADYARLEERVHGLEKSFIEYKVNVRQERMEEHTKMNNRIQMWAIGAGVTSGFIFLLIQKLMSLAG